MKNLKIFIVTYRRSDVLNQTLNRLFFQTDFSNISNTEVNIINNHSDFYIDDKFKERVNVLHNVTRPDWDTGNLARNWNESLIHGFKDLENPDSKIVVTMQNDITLNSNWCSNLLKMNKKYDFIVGSLGDNIVSYRPSAIKRIGLWDERFNSVAHKEADYFLRALILNKDKSLINDVYHNRLLNSHDALPLDEHIYKGGDSKWLEVKHSERANSATRHSSQIFYYKWKNTRIDEPKYNGWLTNWTEDFIKNPPSLPNVKNFVNYHYFEKDVDTLGEQNYVGFKKGDLWMRSTGNLDFDEEY